MNNQLGNALGSIRKSKLLKLYLTLVIAPYFLFVLVMLARFAYGHIDEEPPVSVPWFIDIGAMLIISGVLFMAVLSFMGLLILTGVVKKEYPILTLLLPISQLFAVIAVGISIWTGNLDNPSISVLLYPAILAPLGLALCFLLASLAYKPVQKT